MRRAGATWDPGARQWVIQHRRIGPVIRKLERVVDPLFAQVGMRLDWVGTAFAQDDAEAARKQWRQVADQARPRISNISRLAGLMDDAEA